MTNRTFLIFGSLTVVMLLVVAGGNAALNGPVAADPCAATSGAASIANRVCLDGVTITTAEGWVHDVAAGAHAGVTFVTFHVDTATPMGAPYANQETLPAGDPRVVISRDGTHWSPHLPGGDALRLRHAPDVEPLTSDAAGWGDDPYRIIRLATPLLPEWTPALAASGAQPVLYLPVNHYLVHLQRDDAEPALRALPFVRDVADVSTASKVQPGLVAAGGTPLLHVLTPTNLPGALDRAAAATLLLGGTIEARVDALDRITVRMAAADIPRLAAHPDVLWIDETSSDAETDMDVIRDRVGATAVQTAPLGFDGTGVTGQVMDSGLQTTHPDFQQSLLEVDGPNTVATHGTSVYGIVFGDGTGNSAAVGMAPGASGTFAWYSSGMSRYEHASNLKERWDGVFQTHSWGRGIPRDNTYDSHSVEMDRIVFELDVLGLQSMSNCGPGCARREAMAKNILSIGALYHFNNANLDADRWWAGGSRASTGPASDGRMKPELAGPYDAILTTTVNGYTTGFGGTSGATPVNAGAVAIIHQMAAEGHFGTPGRASPAAAKALAIASAHTYNPVQVDHPVNVYLDHAPQWLLKPYKRDIQGWGVVQLDRLAAAGTDILLVDQTASIATGESHDVTYTVPQGASRVHITLTWTDPPASPAATFALVNDLDLLVSATMGIPYWGNFGLEQATTSLPGGAPDRLNNVENVILPVTGGETLTISVIAAAVNQDADPSTTDPRQRFALAIVPVFD